MENNSVIPLFLALGLMIGAAKIAGSVARALGQPRVFGELVAGIILGPSVLNFLHLPVFAGQPLEATVRQFAELGVLLLMFKVGLDVHLKELLSVGQVALLAGSLGAILPIILAVPVVVMFGFSTQAAIFIGVVLAATSVSISAQTMMELGVLKTREGRALLAAAVVDDVVAILLLSVAVATTSTQAGSGESVLVILLRMVVYSGLAMSVAWFILPRILQMLHDHHMPHGVTAFALIFALIFGWSAEAFGGIAPITGAFIAGLGLSRINEKIRHEIDTAVNHLAYAFFVPIFFVHVGLVIDLHQITLAALPFAGLLLLSAIASKIIGCGLGARLGGFDNTSAFRLGVSMISRGEVGLIVASAGLALGVFSKEVFPTLFLVILLTTILTPILVRLTFRTVPAVVPEPQLQLELAGGD